MLAINSIHDIRALQSREAVVSVLVASRMDQQALQWIFGAWMELHSLTGMRWHLLVPTQKRSHEDITLRDFDGRLAEEIRQLYRIRHEDTPCLVFDDFNEDHRQHFIRLNGGEPRLKDIFLRCAQTIRDDDDRFGAPNSYARQTAIIGKIFNEAQSRAAFSGLAGIAPHVATIFGLRPQNN